MAPGKRSRSRRLRKKLHVGEFQELAFEFDTEFRQPCSPEEQEALVDAFLAEIIEPGSLGFIGWANGGYVVRYGRGSVTEQERLAIQRWLAGRPEYAAVRVGPLEDAWYPPESDALGSAR